jgi:hypothetical protein
MYRKPFYDQGLPASANDTCLACRGAISFYLIGPHPTLSGSGLEIHTFACRRCGPVEIRTFALPCNQKQPNLTA